MTIPKPKKDWARIIENVVVVAVIIGLTLWAGTCVSANFGCTQPFIKASLIDLPPVTTETISGLPDPGKIMAQAEVLWWMWILSEVGRWAGPIVLAMFGSHKVRKMDHSKQKKNKKGPYGNCE